MSKNYYTSRGRTSVTCSFTAADLKIVKRACSTSGLSAAKLVERAAIALAKEMRKAKT